MVCAYTEGEQVPVTFDSRILELRIHELMTDLKAGQAADFCDEDSVYTLEGFVKRLHSVPCMKVGDAESYHEKSCGDENSDHRTDSPAMPLHHAADARSVQSTRSATPATAPAAKKRTAATKLCSATGKKRGVIALKGSDTALPLSDGPANTPRSCRRKKTKLAATIATSATAPSHCTDLIVGSKIDYGGRGVSKPYTIIEVDVKHRSGTIGMLLKGDRGCNVDGCSGCHRKIFVRYSAYVTWLLGGLRGGKALRNEMNCSKRKCPFFIGKLKCNSKASTIDDE